MTATEFSSLMEEPPGGHNAGRAASTSPDRERHVALSVEDAQASAFVKDGGWGIVTHSGGEWKRAGGTDHRGVLHADEYVDDASALAAVEAHLGFTRDDLHSVYRQGRLSGAQGQLRARIDARLLALSRSGANMLALARVLGLAIKPAAHGGNCRALDNALARARAAELTKEDA